MCGIFGYVGINNGIEYTLSGLSRMEYRGYDSAGIVFEHNQAFSIIKQVGKVKELEATVAEQLPEECIKKALGHTRWATHGIPSIENAHPHRSNNGRIVMVHNGIIENYTALKDILIEHGYTLVSDTDTEVFVNYIEFLFHQEGSIKKAFYRALKEVTGAFAVAIMSIEDKDTIYAMRRGAPLLLGIGQEEYFLASDMCAFLHYTKDVIFLDENEVVILDSDGYSIENLYSGQEIEKTIEHIMLDNQSAQKQGYAHYMLKEIYEQPDVIEQSLLGKLQEKRVHLAELDSLSIERIHIIACGTSYYAGLWGKYIIEELAGIPVEVEIASEFRYRKKALSPSTLLIAITQSGETADTVAGVSIAKELGYPTMAICNVVGSSITRMVDVVLYTHAGPEISVASTKALSSQMLSLLSIALHYCDPTSTQYQEYIKGLKGLGQSLRDILPDLVEKSRYYAEQCIEKRGFFYLGRGYCYPLALEGALKLKELSYIHAEGYASGEMKHGPIALIEDSFMSIVLLFDDEVGKKTQSAIAEIQARSGAVLAIVPEGIKTNANFEWHIPYQYGVLQSFLFLPALQLFSYSFSCLLEHDVDMPRNLAKSVTVE